MERLHIEDVAAGMDIPPLIKQPTMVTQFLFGVAYWTAHRIHYDKEWARSEGYPDVLVVGSLMNAYLAEMLVTWAGYPGALRKLSITNRALAFPGDTLTARGIVRRLYQEGADHYVECDVFIEKQDGVKPIVGSAVLRLPSRGG